MCFDLFRGNKKMRMGLVGTVKMRNTFVLGPDGTGRDRGCKTSERDGTVKHG